MKMTRTITDLAGVLQKAGDDLDDMIGQGCFLRCRKDVELRLREIGNVIDDVWSELDEQEYHKEKVKKRGFWARVFGRK
jgi:hypothetical protein